MAEKTSYLWSLWIARVGATGINFARGRSGPAETLLVHAPPQVLDVEVHDSDGKLLARGENLKATMDSPMTRLRMQGTSITREDMWPTEADYGSLVIVAGGEIGTLKQWWNDAERQEWRWMLEFYNHR